MEDVSAVNGKIEGILDFLVKGKNIPAHLSDNEQMDIPAQNE